MGKQVVQTLPGGQGLEPGSNLSPSCVRAAVCTALGRGFAVSRTCSRCSLSSCSPQREAPATGAAPPREFGEVGRSAPSGGQTGERPPPVHAASPVPSPWPQSVSPSGAGRGQAQVVTPGPPQPWPGNAVRTGSRSRFSKSLRRVRNTRVPTSTATQKGALGVRADRPASFPHPLVFLTVCAVGKRESSRLPVNESRQARPSAVARSRCSRGEDAAAGGQSSGDGRGDGAVTRGAAWTGSIGRMNE